MCVKAWQSCKTAWLYSTALRALAVREMGMRDQTLCAEAGMSVQQPSTAGKRAMCEHVTNIHSLRARQPLTGWGSGGGTACGVSLVHYQFRFILSIIVGCALLLFSATYCCGRALLMRDFLYKYTILIFSFMYLSHVVPVVCPPSFVVRFPSEWLSRLFCRLPRIDTPNACLLSRGKKNVLALE